ncbi:MAG: hypothetical protein K6A23_04645 [Butyrivibrio sp.]|nr:hypothetical protein [Butyrivibrio sp.]
MKIGKETNKIKLITPFVMLCGTAIISIHTYLQHFKIGDWLIIVLGSAVLFLIIGAILEKMISYFMRVNQEKEDAERAAAEAEAEALAQEAENQEIEDEQRNVDV